jgi:hypothetical protein
MDADQAPPCSSVSYSAMEMEGFPYQQLSQDPQNGLDHRKS